MQSGTTDTKPKTPLTALGQVVVNYDRCSYCGACVAVCPPDSITLHDAILIIEQNTCTRCRRCLPACPTGALTLELRL